MRWPSIAQLCRNPGNITCPIDEIGRVEKLGDYPYKKYWRNGHIWAFVDFGGSIGDVDLPGAPEGWRVLRQRVQRWVDDGMTLREMLTLHAESNGGSASLNGYLRDIYVKVGTLANRPVRDLQVEEDHEAKKGRRRKS